MSDKKRQPRRTEEVKYYDPQTGELIASELITAAPFIKWGKVAELQKPIVELYVEVGGSIVDLFCHERFLPLCQQLSLLVPVIGQNRPMDFQALVDADDWPQIVRLFVSSSFDEEGKQQTDDNGDAILVKPGLIADLHNLQLNFYRALVAKQEEMEKAREAEEKLKAASLEVAEITKSIS